MKRYFTQTLVLGLMLLFSIPSINAGYKTFYIGDVVYSIYFDENGDVTRCGPFVVPKDAVGTFVIPDKLEYEGEVYTVNFIDTNAFKECKFLTSIIIPPTVTEIEDWAFMDCLELTSIKLPDQLKTIRQYAFSGCEKLNSITIPDGIKELPGHIFNNCKNLTSITFPENLESIGPAAFSGCSSLETITIPESVTSIGDGVFKDCSNLIEVIYPDGITAIGYNSFWGCKNLESFNIPSSVTSIGTHAFGDCEKLKSIELPEQLVKLGEYAFDGCKNLESINIPKGVTTIEKSTFSSCEKLSSIELDAVVKIGSHAFSSCKSLKTVTLSDNLELIEKYAFYFCNSLASMEFPKSLLEIQDNAFVNCLGITSLSIPGSIKTIGKDAFAQCKGIKELTLENGIESIGEGAFRSCDALTSVAIPESITLISRSMFGGCTNIESIFIPGNILEIGEAAFNSCKNLKSITICDGVEKIAESAFDNCDLIENITILSPKPPVIEGSWVFTSSVKENCVLYVPEDAIETYKNTEGWNSFKNIEAIRIEIEINDSKYSVVGDKATVTSVNNNSPSIAIPATITNDGKEYKVLSIGKNAFANCNLVIDLTLPNTINSIGNGAFSQCGQLRTIYIYAVTPPVFSAEIVSRAASTEEFPEEVYEECLVYVPAGALESYRTAPVWENFKNILEIGTEPSLSLDKEEASVNIGETITLTATVIPDNATLSWKSSDNEVATVNNGEVEGIKAGKAVITVTSSTGFSAECTITVIDPSQAVKITSLTLSETDVELPLNYTYSLFGIIAPENATNTELEWGTSNPDVARVYQGVVYGIVPGEAVITAKTTDGSNLSASCKFTIVATSGIEGTEGDAVRVSGKAGIITVKGATVGATVEVYSISGACVAVKTVESSVEELSVAASGIYVVRVNGKAFKVAL